MLPTQVRRVNRNSTPIAVLRTQREMIQDSPVSLTSDRVHLSTARSPKQHLRNLVFLEQNVNNGRFAGNQTVRFPKEYPWSPQKGPFKLSYASIPREEVRFFGKGSIPQMPEHLGLTTKANGKEFVLFPVHWELQDKYQREGYSIEERGLVDVSASIRTVYIDPKAPPIKNAPSIAGNDWAHTSIKMHFEHNIPGGIVGSREITAQKAEIAPILTAVLEHLIQENRVSPYLKIMPESFAMADKEGRGVIFRSIPEGELFPAFSLYSPLPKEGIQVTFEVLEGEQNSPLLAIDILNKVQKTQKIEKLEAFSQVFVEPLMDVIFSMAKEGISHEIHPQNLLFQFEAETGKTKSIVLRDLHGLNYSVEARKRKGLPDLFSQEYLQKMGFSNVSPETLNDFFRKDGKNH